MRIRKKEKETRGGAPAPAAWKLPGRKGSGKKAGHSPSSKKNPASWRARLHRHRFPNWQKIWFFVSLACLAAILILGIYRNHAAASLTDQNVYARWDADGTGAAQVSCFFRDGSTVSEDFVRELNYNITRSLTSASVSAVDGADPFIWCASGTGSTTISYKENQSSVTAIGVLGDFFDFHLFHYLSGGPFVIDNGMRDQVVIDEYTAWKLFGSNNVVGQTVDIGGVNHLIAGVIKRPSGRFVREAGISKDSSICIMSYKSLLQYTSDEAVPSQEDSNSGGQSTDSNDQDNQDGGDSGDSQNVGLMNIPDSPFGVKVLAADAETSSEGSAVQDDVDAAGTETQSGEADTSSTQESTVQEADTSSSAAESGSTDTSAAASGTETPGTGATQDDLSSEETGTQNTDYTDTGRITCYEVVMPEPVSGFAGNIVRRRAGSSSDRMVVVNSSRFSTASLIGDLRGFALRSMATSGYTFPYWENVARGWESVLSLVVLIQLVLIAVPVIFAFVMIIYYFRHRKWTAGGVFRKIKDRIYDRQSEKRYGKGKQAPGLSTLTDEHGAPDEIPDRSGLKEKEEK